MAIKIIKEANKKNPIYFRHCDRCGCEFEFNKSDIHSEFFDQREGYNVIPLSHALPVVALLGLKKR